MLNKSDPFYGALLVEDARLHLGTVMAGQDSEPFFMTMLKIVESNIYLGYTTIRGKEVKLRGIKDFIHSVYYGLGVKDLGEFILAVTKSALKEKSKNRYAYKFIDWLKEQDQAFNFPESFFEYRRIVKSIAINRKKKKFDKILDYRTAKYLYQMQPSLLADIGPGRKYKSVQECYYAEGYGEKKQTLKPIKIFQNPTNLQVEEVGKLLFERFGSAKSRILALNLLEQCADARAARAGDPEPADDDDAAWPEWA
jgi:hypothetical protein